MFQQVIVPVEGVVVGPRKRPLDEAKVAELAASIAAVGLLQPIVVTDTYGLVAGRHRLEAARRLGWQTLPAHVAPLDALRAELAEIDENLMRAELTVLEQGEHLLRRGELLEALGERARVGWNGNQYTATPDVGSDKLTPPKTTAALAAEAGMGERSAQRRLQIARNVAPDVKEAIAATPLADRADDLLQLARLPAEEQREVAAVLAEAGAPMSVAQARRALTARARRETPPLPTAGKYRVLYTDPPWRYNDSGVITGDDRYGRAERHYPPLSIEELCALPVGDLAEDDAVLFLWVTSPLLEACFEVIRAWGFAYKTSFVWDKVRHNFGHYNSVRHELLLVCTRGSCTPDNPRLIDSVQTVERSAVHSQKPEAFREIIDSLYPHGRRLELFARQAAEGWEAWGNEC
jgi:N6-adenosine-specific RNA methylase IME4